jgi:hypothetical protein
MIAPVPASPSGRSAVHDPVPDQGHAPALPWTTPPTDRGDAICDWCGRAIYVPAVPCSVRPVRGLASMDTAAGLGDRCKWELTTRVVPDPHP